MARLGAIKAKTAATNTLGSMIVTVPEPLRARLPADGLPNKIINACLRPNASHLDDPLQAIKAVLRSIARPAKALRDKGRRTRP